MSEPVGLGPRADIPGNSHKNRNSTRPEPAPRVEQADPVERPVVEKVTTGKVVTKKKNWFRRIAVNLIVDDVGSIGEFITNEVLLPAIKNVIADTVTQGTNRMLGFEASRSRRSSPGGGGSNIRTRYDNMPTAGGSRVLGRESRARHDFDELILDSRAEAVEVLNSLEDLVTQFRSASVADLYDLVGVTGSFTDRRWGWTDLITADIRPTRGGGYRLDLPIPEPIRR